MGIREWLSQNLFNLFTVVGILGSWWCSIVALRRQTNAMESDAKARRAANLLTITANHRELWKECVRYPVLDRVIDPSADVAKQPVTPAEEFFMNMAISHTSSTYEALKDELLTEQEGLRRDVKSFYSLPVPHAVWQRTKLLQNQDFAAFVDSSLK
jgi:hypothetical protein